MKNFLYLTLGILVASATMLNVAAAQSTDPLSGLFDKPTTSAATTTDTNTSATTATANNTTTNSSAKDLPAVTGVSVSADGTSAQLSWGAVAGADNYTIYFGRKSVKEADYNHTIPAGNVTSRTIKDLLPGDTYYFAVTAENTKDKIGSKYYSDEISVTIPNTTAKETVASAPTDTETKTATEASHSSAPKIERLPKSGPEVLLAVYALAAGGAYFLRRKLK